MKKTTRAIATGAAALVVWRMLKSKSRYGVKHESVWWIRKWREWHYAQCRHYGLWLTKAYITHEYNETCRECRRRHGHP